MAALQQDLPNIKNLSSSEFFKYYSCKRDTFKYAKILACLLLTFNIANKCKRELKYNALFSCPSKNTINNIVHFSK